MRAHRCIWWVTLVVGVVPAAMLGVLEAPTLFVIVITMALGLLGGWLLTGGRVSWGSAAENALAVVLVAIAAPALAGRELLVIPLLVGSSTTCVRRARAGVRPLLGKRDRPGSGRPTYVGACLGSMSGRELCQAWRASFAELKSERARDRRVQAGVRRNLLDELERRDGDRFRAWLARSPSAASDPLWVVSLPVRSSSRRPRR